MKRLLLAALCALAQSASADTIYINIAQLDAAGKPLPPSQIVLEGSARVVKIVDSTGTQTFPKLVPKPVVTKVVPKAPVKK